METSDNPASGTRLRERGNSLVEYVLLMALIALVCIAALSFFGSTSGNSVTNSATCISAADGSAPAANCVK